MHHRRHSLFTLVCAVSLLFAAALGIAWAKSFHSEWDVFTFKHDEETYTLRSKGGAFVLFGPPTEQVSSPIPREVVFRMSNEDFEWSEIGSEYVCGAARRDTPTWDVYQHYFARERRGLSLEPAMRIFIEQNRHDPKRFVPAHMLFMFAAEKKSSKRPVAHQKWKEVGVRTDSDGSPIPEVIMWADAQQKGPDFASRWDLKPEWSDVMESPRGALFHGWIFLPAMIMPLVWIARPRRRKSTWSRWIFNWLALTSFILCSMATMMWIRSRWIDEQFVFAQRDAAPVAGFRGPIDSVRSIGSSQGELRMMRQDIPRFAIRADLPWGYQRQIATFPKTQGVSGEKSLKVFGVNSYELPSQFIKPSPTPPIQPGRPPPQAIPQALQLMTGVKALAIRWWLIILVSAIVPALWGWSALAWRSSLIKAGIRCSMCGYDMRATPDRCPECGQTPIEGMNETPILYQ